MKFNAYITRPEDWVNGEQDLRLEPQTEGHIPDRWILAGEVDLELNVDRQTVVQKALEVLEATEKYAMAEHYREMQDLQARKDNLLALPAPDLPDPREGDATSAYVNQD